jgi:katanin p60 ATPase-containing subunit A1
MSLKDMMNRSSGGKSAGMYTNDDNSRIGPPPVRLGGGGPGINYKDPHLEEPYMGRSRTPPSIPSKRNAMCRSSYYESNEDTRGQSNQDLNSSYLEITIEEKISNCYGSLSHHHDRAVVDMVLGDIVQRDLGVTFDDISALHTAKRLLNEAVVLPMMMPELFTGIRVPWKVWNIRL